MATYTETAWGSSDGTYPTSILTKRWTTTNETLVACHSETGAEDSYVFAQEWSVGSVRRLNSWDATEDSNHANIELLCRFKLEGTTRQDYEFGLVVRGSGAGATETAYECYLLEGASNALGVRIAKMNAGTGAVLQDSGDILTGVGAEWLWIRFRANSTDLKAKLWRDGDTEPSAWSVETTDGSITAAGWNGFWGYISGLQADADYLSAGTNGDTAPLTADTSNVARTTSVTAHALIRGNDQPVRVTSVTAHALIRGNDQPVRVTSVTAHVLYKITPPESEGIDSRPLTVTT